MANDPKYWTTPSEAMSQLTWGKFPEYNEQLVATFTAMENMGEDPDDAIDKAGDCLRPVHANYSAETNAELLRRFPEVQKALFGLELDPVKGRRYREHFLHMFNVWTLGGRILAPLIQRPDEVSTLFRVQDEPDLGLFPEPYNRETRLWFIWALMSTFHDVGIPVEHLDEVNKGLKTYLEFFEMDLHDFVLEVEPAAAISLAHHFSLMSRMFSRGVEFDPDRPGYYRWANDPDSYFWRVLVDAFSKRQHGVVAAIRLFRSVEVLFMRDLHSDSRYHLQTMQKWNTYVDGVLDQDITRAAVGVALHSIKHNDFPRLFPLSFRRYPLTFLLMLCDELQEFFRLEGITLKGVVPLKRMPVVNCGFSGEREKRVVVDVTVYYEAPQDRAEEDVIVASARAYASSPASPSQMNSFEDVIVERWNETTSKLCARLLFRESEPIHVRIRVFFKPPVGGIHPLQDFDSDRDCGSQSQA